MISVSWSLTRQDHGEQPFWMAIMLASMIGQIGLPGGGFGFGYSATNHIGGQFTILPGAAFTEQSGHYTNLEGKIQKAYKASYPPGEAKEDWQIINDLAEIMNKRKLFNDKDELESSMFNYLKIKKDKQSLDIGHKKNVDNFVDEVLKIDFKDYYFSNVVARSSKTMLECNNSKLDFKKTGTEG